MSDTINKYFQKTWHTMRPFFGSSAIVLAAMIMGKAFSFFWRILLLHYDVSFLGEIEIFLTTLALAVSFSNLALPAALLRFALQHKKQAKAYFLLATKYTLIAFLLVCLASLILSQAGLALIPYTNWAVGLFFLLILLLAIQNLSLAYFNSQKKFVWYGLGQYAWTPIIKFLFLGLILLGIFSKNFLFNHVPLSMGLAAISVILLLIGSEKWQQIPALALKQKREFVSYSILLSVSFLAFMLYGAVDIYALQYFFNPTVVGIYIGLLTLTNLTDLLFLPFLQTFQAHLSEKDTIAAKVKFTQGTTNILVKLGLVVGLAIIAVGPFFLRFINQDLAIISFWILSLFVISKIMHSGIVLVYRHYFDFQGQQIYTAKTMVISLLAKIVLCLLLVPQFGLAGLAVANIITDATHILLLEKKLPR